MTSESYRYTFDTKVPITEAAMHPVPTMHAIIGWPFLMI